MISKWIKIELYCLLFLFGGLLKIEAQCNRLQMVTDYETQFLRTQVSSSELGWTGNIESCQAGTISTLALHRSVDRINYFRSLAGLPTHIEFDTSLSERCQEAALIMHKNNELDHFPDTTWACWTEGGRKAASKSNLALGAHSTNAISLYMRDPGSNNWAVGHRRWILYSRAKAFGMGSTSRAHSLWVIHNKIPAPEDLEYVAYPSPGYFPAPLIYDRWSLSVPGGKFMESEVYMTDENGDSIALLVHPIKNGFGDNTLVWEPSPGSILKYEAEDKSYNVEVKNIIKGGDTTDISYKVIVAQTTHPPVCATNKIWSESDCLCKESVTTQTNESNNHKISVFPNPTRDQLFIQFNENVSDQDVRIRLMNMNGKKLKEIKQSVRQNLVMNVSNLPGGIYQCQILFDGWTQTRKVIILN